MALRQRVPHFVMFMFLNNETARWTVGESVNAETSSTRNTHSIGVKSCCWTSGCPSLRFDVGVDVSPVGSASTVVRNFFLPSFYPFSLRFCFLRVPPLFFADCSRSVPIYLSVLLSSFNEPIAYLSILQFHLTGLWQSGVDSRLSAQVPQYHRLTRSSQHEQPEYSLNFWTTVISEVNSRVLFSWYEF